MVYAIFVKALKTLTLYIFLEISSFIKFSYIVGSSNKTLKMVLQQMLMTPQ